MLGPSLRTELGMCQFVHHSVFLTFKCPSERRRHPSFVSLLAKISRCSRGSIQRSGSVFLGARRSETVVIHSFKKFFGEIVVGWRNNNVLITSGSSPD